MQQLDDRILEFLEGDGQWSVEPLATWPPFEGVSEGRLQERVEVLATAGLIDTDDEDAELFEISYWGERYLEGEVHADLLSPRQETHPWVRDGQQIEPGTY